MGTADAQLVSWTASFDTEWLARRRWFRSKARPLAAVEPRDAVRVDDDAWLVVVQARYADGGSDRYLVPAILDADGRFREPADDEGAWRSIVARLLDGRRVAGEAGVFAFHSTPALATLVPGGIEEVSELDERRLSVEQSNTSVRLGDRLILKVYRLLEPGPNPEVEVNAFLTDVGFANAPAMAGWVTYGPPGEEPACAAMLQSLVASRGDGWQWILGRLGDPPSGPIEALAAAAQIGGITSEMHAALASRPDDPAFPVRVASARELAEWRRSAEQQLDEALQSVSGTDRDRLEEVDGRIRERLAAIDGPEGPAVTRIHGDYHLGQLLRTESAFSVIDFEGEPARPISERRRPASPLRDVAGMLRSFDYAARTAERQLPGFAPDDWLANARSAFLSAYGADEGDGQLLAAFEAEKACYEVRYEANNRPDWTWLPVAALERLAS